MNKNRKKLLAGFNNVLACSVIMTFLTEFSVILFANFDANTGTTKAVALGSFTLIYGWRIIPAIIALLILGIKKNQILLIIAIIINSIILIQGMPMLIEYFNR